MHFVHQGLWVVNGEALRNGGCGSGRHQQQPYPNPTNPTSAFKLGHPFSRCRSPKIGH